MRGLQQCGACQILCQLVQPPAQGVSGGALPTLAPGTRSEASAEKISVSYGGVLAVVDVDVIVEPGQLVGLIGPNGAGKTTFIDAGMLVTRQVSRPRTSTTHYAWRESRQSPAGHALRWWLDQLAHEKTRSALLQPAHRV